VVLVGLPLRLAFASALFRMTMIAVLAVGLAHGHRHRRCVSVSLAVQLLQRAADFADRRPELGEATSREAMLLREFDGELCVRPR